MKSIDSPTIEVDSSEKASAAPYATPTNPSADPHLVPIVTMTQDIQIFAQPKIPSREAILRYQSAFPTVKLNAGLPDSELSIATDPAQPFHFQLPFSTVSTSAGFPKGIAIWRRTETLADGTTALSFIPEGAIPNLWPLAAFAKLSDDSNPQAIVTQGNSEKPIVVIQGITLAGDDLLTTAFSPPSEHLGPSHFRDHVTVLVRPAAICFNPKHVDAGGVLVTPHDTGVSADPNEPGERPLFKMNDLVSGINARRTIVREVVKGCLPIGRYAINLAYPTGQAWTVPNETGSCAQLEGATDFVRSTCTVKSRPILPSQGHRAVLEVIPPPPGSPGETYCKNNPVPKDCFVNN